MKGSDLIMNKRHRGLLDWPVVATRLSQDVISMEANYARRTATMEGVLDCVDGALDE